MSIHLTWVTPCHTQQYHIYYRGTCESYLDEGRLDTDRQEYTLDGLQEGVNYSFTVNQTGFSGGGVFSTGPVYARTFTAGKLSSQYCTEHIANELQNEYHCIHKHANNGCFNCTVIACKQTEDTIKLLLEPHCGINNCIKKPMTHVYQQQVS